MQPIVLASKSPRRKQLLSWAEIPFEVIVKDTDESFPSDLSPEEVPVFIGHYSLNGHPSLLKKNICCLDYGVVKNEKITAYRWNGEQKLINKNFIQS